MIILDGKKLSQKILAEIKQKVLSLSAKPGLAVVLVGNDEASRIYVGMKHRKCEEVGMVSFQYEFPEDVAQQDILALIEKLNKDQKVHGILVQLPLPKQFNKYKIIEAIDPRKDVDGIHPLNIGKMALGLPGILPCTPLGILKLFEEYEIGLEGKKIVVVGNSIIVGDPVAELLSQRNATVTICNDKTKDLGSYTREADIVISATGVKHLITESMIKAGAVVVDVGITREDGKIFGDVDFDNVKQKCSHITPMPGGVGPMTIASLMENTLKAYNFFQD